VQRVSPRRAEIVGNGRVLQTSRFPDELALALAALEP
jgi:hypothetical protein